MFWGQDRLEFVLKEAQKKLMIKNIIKKFFIKVCRLLDFEIIDQNQFTSPTLGSSLNENLSKINKKSIVLPLGEVKIKRKIISLNIIF